jgi:hypothetical protein
MYLVITEFNRPSEDIPYYIDTNTELKAAFLDFIENNKELIEDMQVLNEGTKQTTVLFYADKATFNIFIGLLNSAFPTLFADRDAYCLANNITMSRIVEEL